MQGVVLASFALMVVVQFTSFIWLQILATAWLLRLGL